MDFFNENKPDFGVKNHILTGSKFHVSLANTKDNPKMLSKC